MSPILPKEKIRRKKYTVENCYVSSQYLVLPSFATEFFTTIIKNDTVSRKTLSILKYKLCILLND